MVTKEALADTIVDFIEDSGLSATQFADALHKTGELDSRIRPISPGLRAVGRLYYAPGFDQSNWHMHYFLENLPPRSVVYVEGVNCERRALFGSLVAGFVFSCRQAAGMVVSGWIRDAEEIIRNRYPIWAFGATPIGCFNREIEMDSAYYEKRRQELGGSVVVADDAGVIVARPEQITPELYEAVQYLKTQEEVWEEWIHEKGCSTFQTVCLKEYLDDVDHEKVAELASRADCVKGFWATLAKT